MDEKKETTSKKINLKNKKAATKALSKTKTQKTKTTKKTQAKKKTAPKKTTVKESLTKETLTKGKTTKKVEKKTTDKKVTKTKKTTKAKPKKKAPEEKAKLVLPKEWEKVNKTKENKQLEATTKIGGKIKNSIFEEVDEKTFIINKEKEKRQLKKYLITIAVVVIVIALSIFVFIKYDEHVRESLMVYEEYFIGDKVELKDGSTWYVIKNTDKTEKEVKLLKENVIDTNGDNIVDAKDRKKYNSKGYAEYDDSVDDSVAKYLKETYAVELENSVGGINEVSLLTSQEYVKIREKMGFGYEWKEGNFLASKSIGNWWVISEQNNKVYAVTATGLYKLCEADTLNYVRPTIVIDKDKVKKYKEKEETKEDTEEKTTENKK